MKQLELHISLIVEDDYDGEYHLQYALEGLENCGVADDVDYFWIEEHGFIEDEDDETTD